MVKLYMGGRSATDRTGWLEDEIPRWGHLIIVIGNHLHGNPALATLYRSAEKVPPAGGGAK